MSIFRFPEKIPTFFYLIFFFLLLGVLSVVTPLISNQDIGFIISIKDGVGKASARSVVGFDIGSAIIAATQEKILLKGGGHKMAGGFSINISNIEKFKTFITRKFKNINTHRLYYYSKNNFWNCWFWVKCYSRWNKDGRSREY